MGIKNLNKYLYDTCSKKSIRKIDMVDMRGKTIVIDTSIYIYKYLKENKLEQNFSKMIQSFLKHQIRPIFIFDGKTPLRKLETVKERSRVKKEAEMEYNKLKDSNCSGYSNKLIELKKKFVRVQNDDITMLKELMKSYRVEVIQCEWESDSTCAEFVKKRHAWACMSDDLDMLVYGCERIIRDFSINSFSAQLYLLSNILNEIKLSMNTFRDIMVLSGTDYSGDFDGSDVSLSRTLSLHNDYLKCSINETFYIWLMKNTSYIKNYQELMEIHKIFC